MTLHANARNDVNGLQVWPTTPPASERDYESAPSVRQLALLEQGINACSFDWNRLQGMGLGTTPVFVHWVKPELLYAGHIGTTELTGVGTVPNPTLGPDITLGPGRHNVTLPDGQLRPAAFAPLTRPNGRYGDYGGIHMVNGQTSLYLLDTLDQAPPPFGGARFYMETVVRLLGIAHIFWLCRFSAAMRDRLARCFTPVDRMDFPSFDFDVDAVNKARGVTTWNSPVPAYFGNEAATNYGNFPGLASNDWYFESSGIAFGVERLLGNEAVYQGTSGQPANIDPEGWGTAGSARPAPAAWQTRLFEAVGEHFKDLFLPKAFRQTTNRTAVKLRAARGAFEAFVDFFQAEVPGPRDGAGLFGGTRTDRDYSLDNAHLTESTGFITVPGYSDTVTIEFDRAGLLNLAGLMGKYDPVSNMPFGSSYFHWTLRMVWADIDRPSRVLGEASTLAGIAPLRFAVPVSDLQGRIVFTLQGVPQAPASQPALGAIATIAITPAPFFYTYAGQSGTQDHQYVEQWNRWRILSPSGGRPKFPYGSLTVTGVDEGARRTDRGRVGGHVLTPEMPRPSLTATRPSQGGIGVLALGSDQGTTAD